MGVDQGEGIPVVQDSPYEFCRKMYVSASEWVKENLPNTRTPLSDEDTLLEVQKADLLAWSIVAGILHMKSNNTKTPCVGVTSYTMFEISVAYGY